jgi:hypothetical protein
MPISKTTSVLARFFSYSEESVYQLPLTVITASYATFPISVEGRFWKVGGNVNFNVAFTVDLAAVAAGTIQDMNFKVDIPFVTLYSAVGDIYWVDYINQREFVKSCRVSGDILYGRIYTNPTISRGAVANRLIQMGGTFRV